MLQQFYFLQSYLEHILWNWSADRFLLVAVLFSFLPTWYNPGTSGKGDLDWKAMPPSDWPVPNLWGALLINDWCTRAQPSVGSAAPRQVALGCIRKQFEQAVKSTSRCRISLPPLLQFLSPGSCPAGLPAWASFRDQLCGRNVETRCCVTVSSEMETFYPAGRHLKQEDKQFKIALGSPWNWQDSLGPSLPE